MLSYSDITQRKYIVLDGEPYEVLSSAITKKQRQKPTNQTKLKNLKSGKVTEKSFHQSDTVEEADIIKKKVLFIYSHRDEFWFGDVNNAGNRWKVDEEHIGNQKKYLKEKTTIDILLFKEEIIGIALPPKVDLLVTDAPPAVKGNTAQGGNKQITLETGMVLNAPLFINTGDTVRVNTETGEYSERVDKK